MASGNSFNDDERSSLLISGFPNDPFSHAASSSISTSAPPSRSTTSKRKYEPHKAKPTWDHFRRAQDNEPDRAPDDQRLWYCQKCKSPSWATQVSGNARKHLAKSHGIIIVAERSKGKKARHEQLKDIFARVSTQKIEKVEEHEEKVLERAINKEALNEALVRLITGCNLPHNAVEWPQ
ncbi:hypothetical protein DM02DRAFT_548229, partial [Periconia macrospinosa]